MNGIFYERSLEFAFKLLCQAFVTYNSGQCNVFQIEVNLFLDSDDDHVPNMEMWIGDFGDTHFFQIE